MIKLIEGGDESIIDGVVSRLEQLSDSIIIIDCGGGIKPLARADYVVDRIPYRSRSGIRGSVPERFSEQTWIEEDLCDSHWVNSIVFSDRDNNTISNRRAFCSQTIEDIRDPVGLLRNMQEIASSGFISTIHWTYEAGHHGHWQGPGYAHHRWLIHVKDSVLECVHKPLCLMDGPLNYPHRQQYLHLEWSDNILAREVFYPNQFNRMDFISWLESRWE